MNNVVNRAPDVGAKKAKFNKFLTLLAVMLFGLGQMWATDITVTPPTPNNASNPFSAGLYVMSHSGTGSKLSSGAITTSTNGDVITITFQATKSDMYIKTITFNSLGNGTLSSEDGDFDGQVFSATGNKNSVNIVLTSASGKKGTVKVTNVVVNTGTNVVEEITFTGAEGKNATFTSSVGTSALSSISTDNSSCSVSDGKLAWANNKKIILTSESNIKYVAFSIADGKMYSTFSATEETYNSANYSWSGSSKTVTLTNGSGGGRNIQNLYAIIEAATNYTVTIDPNGGSYASTPDGWTLTAGVYTKEIAEGTSFTAPAGLSKGTDDLSWKDGSDNPITFPVTISGDITFVAQWAPHAASSDATLSALSVAGGTLNETFDPDEEDYTITLPFYASMPAVGDVTATKNDPNAADPEVSISGNVITIHCEAEDGTTTKDYTITVTIAPAPAASSSINIEQLILDNSKAYNIGAALDAAHIGYVSKDALDSLKSVAEKADRNEPYLGLKFKTPTSKVTIIVPDGEYLKVKFGYIDGSAGLKVSVNGSAAAAPSLTSGVYTLAASAGIKEVVFTQTGSNKTVVYKQIKINEDVDAVTLPWLVTYTVGEHGTCAKAKETWKGSALTLPAVTPESGWTFDGWFTAASAGTKVGDAGDSYTPTADVELFAQYTALASPFDLTALTYKIGTGAAQNVGYVDGTFTYNIELPYASSYEAITVTPTLKEATSYLKGDEVLTVSSLPGAATFTVVEDGGANEQLYTVNFTKAAKDAVCLIWGDVANNSLTRNATKSQMNGTLANSNVRDNAVILDELIGPKFQSNGYLSIALEGQDIKAGDQVKIFVTSLNGLADKLRVFNANEAIDANVVAISAENMTTRVNTVTMTADASTIYLRRGNDYSSWNPCVAYVAVYRAMNPVLTAITFDGVAADKDSEFAFSATLPQGTNLGTMTVTPTIVWNGAGTSAPTAAWAWGANTYRVTDKDGDYTDYTITLTEALAPSAAPTITTQPADANYYEGATIDALEVVATGSGDLTYQWFLGSDEIDGATNATYTPTVTAIGTYVYHCVVTNTEAGHPATSLASDEATITISEDPAAIKLLDGSTVNHTNFITGVTADETVEFKGNTVNYAKFSGTVGGVNGVKDLTRVIAYNATTTQTKIKVSVHNNSTNARSCYVKGLVEGADAAVDLATISLTNKEDKISDWITFDNAANRTIYIFVSSDAGDVYFTQVKVIESGTDLKMAGEAGYSLNFDHGRFFGVKDVTAHFEELDVEVASSDCQPLNTSVVKLANSSISFEVTAPVTLTVTTNNNKTYYVTKGSAGTDNETAKAGATDFNLTAGTWFITGGSSNVEITNIAFALPKCEQPTITTQPATKIDFPAGDLTATVVASVTDGGTLSYQWYNASDDSEVAGATDATLTTITEGTYYVIVTNTLADHSDNFIKSDNATLRYRTVDDATLSALSVSAGTLDPAFDPAVLEYDVYLPEGTTDVPTLSATAAMEAYGATADITDATVFVSYEATSTVLVTAEDGTTKQTYTVNFHVAHTVITLADVTGNTTWNWTDITGRADGSAIDDGSGNGPIVHTEDGLILANYLLGGDNWDKLEGNNGAYAIRKAANKYYQGASLHMHTTVPGLLKINARNDGNPMKLKVGNNEFTLTGSFANYELFVPAGDVTIYNVPETAGKPMRIARIDFTAKAAPDYTRDDSWMAPGELGTVCIANGAIAVGGDIYELMGKNAEGKIVFASVDVMEPGVPYLFQAKSNRIDFYYTSAEAALTPDNSGAMKGSFVGGTTLSGDDLIGVYYFNGHALWNAAELDHLDVIANRAYVYMPDVPTLGGASPAPGRRYITMSVHGENAAQGFDNIETGDAPMKVMIDGTLYILRGEKVFDATGRLVK